MRHGRGRLVLTGLALLALAGCATERQWDSWQAHPTHFASGDHLLFSVRNREGTEPRVTRHDVSRARAEAWWGGAVTVREEAILQR
jgi:uncharacterized protein (DUF2267 family)